MMSEIFEMDEIDREIIKLIQQAPGLTHTQIAKKVNRSQPTIGLRIKKLEQSGVLKFQAGLNMKAADLVFSKLEIKTNLPQVILAIAKNCPFMVNAFRVSGEYNIMIIVASLNLVHLERIVNLHFRSNPEIIDVRMEVITEVMNDFVLPIDLEFGKCGCSSDFMCLDPSQALLVHSAHEHE